VSIKFVRKFFFEIPNFHKLECFLFEDKGVGSEKDPDQK